MMKGGSAPGVCLIGCGAWGAVHALALKSMNARVRRFYASRSPARAREFAGRFAGEAAFDRVDQVWADPRVSAVVIATPHHLHAQLAREALLAGKHVLVEKPIALSLEEARGLVQRADAEGLCLAVAEQYRVSRLIGATAEALRAGLIGPVVFARVMVATRYTAAEAWKHDRASSGGGVLMDVGIHYVDLLRHLIGEPRAIFAKAQQSGADGAELAASALLSFDDDVSAQLAITWRGHRPAPAPQLELIGEAGCLQVDFAVPWVLHARPLASGHWARRVRSLLPWRLRERVPGLLSRLPDATRRRIRVARADLVGSQALVEDFVAAVVGGGQPAVSGAEGTRDLSVVLAGYASMQRGEVVRIRDPWGDPTPPAGRSSDGAEG